MEAEKPRVTCLSSFQGVDEETNHAKISCFGFNKAKPLALKQQPAPSWFKSKLSVDLQPRRDDSASAPAEVPRCEPGRLTHVGARAKEQDASPCHWEQPAGALQVQASQDELERAGQAVHQAWNSDDEAGGSESASDGNAPLTMHDSTSSLKHGGKAAIKEACAALEACSMAEERLENEENNYLKPEWEINPHDIYFCSRSNGKLCRLGKGAFGTVYKGVWQEQTVAVKVCRQQHVTTRAMKLFQKEVAILHGYQHDNIVQFKGACCWQGGKRTVLVTEYMEKGDLCTALGRAPHKFCWGKLGKSIALDVAKGLAFLHSHNIVHFDLKSANILLDKRNRAKLADVGLAKSLTNTHGSDHLSTFMATGDLGTFAWAAPEVLLGFPCDCSADVFSFGVVTWELVTTEMPQGRCLRPLRVPEECSEEVAELVMDCLRHDPATRPTAIQLVDVLSNL